ncbi:MAG TPA: hypothetical protein VGM77_00345 [Gemmatimonadales bacterium]|jgi:hypothetical protein
MSGNLLIRVRVLEAWDDIALTLPPDTAIAEVKRQALAAAHVTTDASRYLVKFRGAELSNEQLTLATQDVPDDAALIVMRRRRVPVR